VLDQPLGFIASREEPSWPVRAVRPEALPAFLESLPPAQAAFLRSTGFAASAQELVFLPAPDGLAGAVLGLGTDRSPFAFGGLAFRLPADRPWRLEPGDYDMDTAILGFCLGAYRYERFKARKRDPARLVVPEGSAPSLIAAASTWMVRDLVNAPANVLGPAELAAFVTALGERYGASTRVVDGEALDRSYPAISAVGRGSSRRPAVAAFRWTAPEAGDDAPLIALCGKGVCFDTGGYDIKPSAAMLRMKKDMGGAAAVLGVARMIMERQLPVRLSVLIGCVENSVSGDAMRPLDVISTRRGLSVEVGNTDAEGRLVLCDLLAEASDERPVLLLDCGTLTGAARVALGPDIPALFCNDDAWARRLLAAGERVRDPLWRLPLWRDYESWLDSQTADLNNVSAKPFAGAVVAALFLERFIVPGVPWAHVDLYAWNDASLPGRPEGAEAQAIRAIYEAIDLYVMTSHLDQNSSVT
jgi:leucyl aminopeptidase